MQVRRISNAAMVCGVLCTLAAPAGLARGASTGVTPVDPAQLDAFTAKIDTPYPNRFFFEATEPDYPVLEQVVQPPPSPATISLDVQSLYDSPQGGQNSAAAYTDNTGVFYSYARIEDPLDGFDQGYSGVLSSSYWSQAYRITDADIASISYTVSVGRLETYCLGGSVRAELAYDVNLYIPLFGDAPYSNVHEHAGIFALPSNQQFVFESGPMTYATSEPKGVGSKRVTMDPYTGTVDISGLLPGQIIYIEYTTWTAVSFAGFEVSQGEAYFRDPISGAGGVDVHTLGLEAVPEPAALALLALLVPALALRR